MSWLEPAAKSKKSDASPAFDGEQAMRLQMGMASPLWLMFMGAAGAGLAAWSFSRWAKLAIPEAVGEKVVKLRLISPAPEAKAPEPKTEPEVEAAPEPKPEPKIEAKPEPAPAPVVAKAPEPATPVIAEPSEAVVANPAKLKAAPAPKPAPPPAPKAPEVKPAEPAPVASKP